MAVEHVASEKTTHDQNEQKIKQVQIPHRLEWPQALETGREHDEETDGSLEDSIIKES